MSHRPLDQLRREAKAADRAPHLKKRHLPGADQIDVLDRSFGGAYHHDGPYDATLLARNTSLQSSPVEAVRGTNEEALRATPRENITDSLRRHVPLHGTAIIPPGMAGMDGRTMRYEEGADLMREEDAPGGAYRRWGDRVCTLLSSSFFFASSPPPPSSSNEQYRNTSPKTTKGKVNPPSQSNAPSNNTTKPTKTTPTTTAASSPTVTQPTKCNPIPNAAPSAPRAQHPANEAQVEAMLI